MTTDGMSPEMITVIQAIINEDRGWLRLNEIAEVLKMKNQEALYYVDELMKKDLVAIYQSPQLFTDEFLAYHLTVEGRAYYIKEIRDKLVRESLP